MTSIVLTDEQKRSAYQNERLDGYRVYVSRPQFGELEFLHCCVYVQDDNDNFVQYVVINEGNFDAEYWKTEDATVTDVMYTIMIENGELKTLFAKWMSEELAFANIE